MPKKRLAIFLPLAALILVGYLPRIIKYYVESKYPIKVGSVQLGWPVLFRDVQVVLEDTHAELHEVRATPWGTAPIEIQGGTAHVVRKKGQKTAQVPSGGRRLSIHDLDVTIEGDDFQTELKGVNLDSQYRFQSGSVSTEGYIIQLGSGGISKDLQDVTLSTAEVQVSLPFDLPRFPSRGVLQITDLKANRSKKAVDLGSISYGPVRAEQVHIEKQEAVLVKAKTVTLYHPWISTIPISVHDVHLSIPLPIDKVTIGIGLAELVIQPKEKAISGSAMCSDWVQALPDERPAALKVPPENFSGSISFDVHAHGQGKISMEYDCKYKCDEEPIKSLREGKIRYMAYNSKGELFERRISRGSPDWTDITKLPPHVPKAFVTLEDPGFLGHRGIIVQALQNSLKDDLKLGEFFRGGSTITQQLAKNLFLRREKTLSRKVYEAILAMSLESCLSKQEILELYMNVVEFGPDLYGIGPATKRYFNKGVEDLAPEEGFYLAALLPHPKRAALPDHGGLEAAKKLMAHLVTGGLLPDVYLPDDDSVNPPGWQTSE